MEYMMLKDVCAINMGQSPDSDSYNDIGEGVPFFQGNADFGERYPVTRKWCSAPTKMAAPEDILISVRAPIGAMNYAKEECCIGRGLAALTPDKARVSPEFIFWLLKGRNAELNSKGTGSTFKAIGRKVLEETRVPDIPLEKQLEYSEALEKVYSVIQMRREELQKLDDLIKARFVELFGDPVQNTEGWEKDTCKNLTSKIGSGATPKGGRESYGTEGISLIRSMNVYNNRFEYKDLAYITDEQADKLSNVTIEENDVLLNITGASVARCCVVPKELIPARVNQHVAIVRCKDRLLPEFLCNMFTENSYQRLLWSIATSGGATREAITKQQIEDLVLIVPPIELQEQFADFVRQTDKSKVADNFSGINS